MDRVSMDHASADHGGGFGDRDGGLDYHFSGRLCAFSLSLSLTDPEIQRFISKLSGVLDEPSAQNSLLTPRVRVLKEILESLLSGEMKRGNWRLGELEFIRLEEVVVSDICALLRFSCLVQNPESLKGEPDPKECGYTIFRWNIGRVGGAVACCITDEGKVLFIRQYRPTTGRWSLELPRGFSKPGEGPIDTALREAAEEAAATFSLLETTSNPDARVLPHICPENGIIHGHGPVVIIRGARSEEGKQALDGAESGITAVSLTPKEIWAAVRAGEISDATTMAALFSAVAHGEIRPPRV